MNLGQIAVLVWVVEKLSPKKQEKPVGYEAEFIAPSVWSRRIGFIVFMIVVIAALVCLFAERFFLALFFGIFAFHLLFIPYIKVVKKQEPASGQE